MTDRELFLAVLDLPVADRAEFLAKHCGDLDKRQRVERLLTAHEAAGSFLEQPADPGPTATFNPNELFATRDSVEAPGTLLDGRYKLMEQIGEGGMGTVWVAQQTEPVKRLVALKLIKAGMDSKAVLARFDAERQALALMDHPNIARVLDAGASADGRPYFVMELVKGVPITKYCDDRKLTLHERLTLFIPVCQAIQHAHQKGIIHRDIKPTNVLVALYDDRPVPKVIDFGIAKAAGQPMSGPSLYTGFGGVVGTPQYMSPEQATLNNLDIDTRSDIYSLGVLLYELLTGSPPFSQKELEAKGLLEILRMVREQEPPKPSKKLSTADTLPTLSANRGTEPRKLTALLRSELDWVVLKALEKDRSRRYDTATAFAADIQQYLAGEPVSAHPPTWAYRSRKFLRKHRSAVAVATAFLLALLAGLLATSYGFYIATQERLRAEAAEKNALEHWLRAEDDRRRADEALKTTNRQNEATRHAFWKLRSVFSSESFLRTRPELRDHAIAQFRAMLAVFEQLVDESPDSVLHRETLANEYRVMANGLFAFGRYADAETFYLRSIHHHQQLTREVPERTEYEERLANGYADLALLLNAMKRPVEAEESRRQGILVLERARARAPHRRETLSKLAGARYFLAEYLRESGKPTASVVWYEQAITAYRELLRDRLEDREELHYRCKSHWGRAKALDAVGRPQDAVAEWQEAARLAERLGAKEPDHGWRLLEYASICSAASTRLGDQGPQLRDAAIAALKRLLTIRKLPQLALGFDWPEFDPIRGRSDFQQVVAAVEAKLGVTRELAPAPREVKK